MKRQIIFFSLLTITTYVAHAQTTKWNIGVVGSPDYCYRTASGTNYTPYNGKEEGKIGFSAGLQAIYELTEHFNIEAGILFSDMGFRLKNTDLNPLDPNDPMVPNSVSEKH